MPRSRAVANVVPLMMLLLVALAIAQSCGGATGDPGPGDGAPGDPGPEGSRQQTLGFAVDQPITTKDRSWTHAVKEAGDYQLGMAWVETRSGDSVALEIFTNSTHRVKALYAPAGEVTRFETRIEDLAPGDTITVKVTANGGTYRIGFEVAFTTPTFGGLQVFHVADYGAAGDGATDDFLAIQAAVSAAKDAGGGIVQFDGTKTYRSVGMSDLTDETLIELDFASNVKVEGNGARIVLHPPDHFASITYAENIQVDGFTIDYDPLNYYQGTITDINVTNMTIDIEVPERYPEPMVGTSTSYSPFFGRAFIPESPGARSGRSGAGNLYIESTELNGGSRNVRIHVAYAAYEGGPLMQPRLQVVCDSNPTEFIVPHVLYGARDGSTDIHRSSRIKLSNLQYHNLGNFWLSIYSNHGPIALSNVDLGVGDPATELLASWRDGMHISYCRWGILIEDGDWDGAAQYDDTMAIYSRRQVVQSNSGSVATLRAVDAGRLSFLWQPGDWASFWTPDQETLRGMGRVLGVRDVESPSYEVTFESIPDGVSPNDVVLHEESLNRGTLIRNCRTTSIGAGASSTRLRGSDMRFESNHFEDFYFRLDSALGPRVRDVVVEDTYLSLDDVDAADNFFHLRDPLRALFKNCVFDGMQPYVSTGDDVWFDGVAWRNMPGDILSLEDSHAWLFGGSTRNGSAAGLADHVEKDGSSTITYSAPPGYPPAEPPLGGDYTPPDAPVLTASVAGGTVVLEWSDSSGAVAHTVYRRTSPDDLYSRLVGTTARRHVDTSATVGQTAFYVVTATDEDGNESRFSTEASAVPSGTVLSPIADAFVQNGSYTDSNFGWSASLVCKTDSTMTRESYLRFDLSSLSGTIAHAVLRLNVDWTSGSGDMHTAHSVSDDSWGESTIMWNNKPAAGAALDAAVFPAPGEWLELDLTDQAAIERTGDQALSIALIAEGGDLASYHSKEAAGNHPELAVTTMASPPPDPPASLTAVAVERRRALSLSWADQSGSGVSTYGVYRSATSGGPYAHLINTATNHYVDSDIESSKTYFYVVTAINDDGYASGFSDEASADDT